MNKESCKECGRPFVKSRSSRANKRYWALLRTGEDETGQPAETLHEICKALFAIKTEEVFNAVYERVESTSLMSSEEFSDYVDKVELWLMEHGVSLEPEYT